MKRMRFFSLLFAISVPLFFLPQIVNSQSWLGLAESAPFAFLSVILAVVVDRRISVGEYQSKGLLSRRLACGFLFIAGFIAIEIPVFYLVLTIPGFNTGRYAANSFWAIYTAISSELQPRLLHLGGHFAFSSALAAGYGITLVALAAGPVWSGDVWGWKAVLLTGLIPSVGLIVSLFYYPLDHPYFAVFPIFWFLGTLLAWASIRSR